MRPSESSPDRYNAFAEEWDRTRQHAWREFDVLKNIVTSGSHVLDIGCGNGRLYSFLQDHCDCSYVGIDTSTALIAIAKNRYPDEDFRVADALHIPVEGHSVNIAVSIAVLHHFSDERDRRKFFTEIARTLVPNGHAYVTVWNLFQPRYRSLLNCHFLRKIITTLRHPLNTPFGFRDALVPFGSEKHLRYVHAFTPREVQKLLPDDLLVEKVWFTKKGEEVHDWKQAHNLCFMLRKRIVR